MKRAQPQPQPEPERSCLVARLAATEQVAGEGGVSCCGVGFVLWPGGGGAT